MSPPPLVPRAQGSGTLGEWGEKEWESKGGTKGWENRGMGDKGGTQTWKTKRGRPFWDTKWETKVERVAGAQASKGFQGSGVPGRHSDLGSRKS